jgi:hypothetical protein
MGVVIRVVISRDGMMMIRVLLLHGVVAAVIVVIC